MKQNNGTRNRMKNKQKRTKYPKVGSIVVAVVRHFHTKGTRTVTLKYVAEDDCNWRTADDGSELSHDWDVVKWADLPEVWHEISAPLTNTKGKT
jgi:hypothetical protein